MLDKLAQKLTDKATEAVVGHKIIAIKFNVLLQDKPGLYHASFILLLDNGTVIDCNGWRISIQVKIDA